MPSIRGASCAGLIAAAVVAVLPVQPASAAGPTVTKVLFSGGADNVMTCAGSGVNVAFAGERTYIDFYASDGTLVKEIRQITYTGTLTNSVTEVSVPYDGHFVRTQDFVSDTITITGLQNRVLLPGQGVVAINVGLLVLSPDGVTQAGSQQWDAGVCAALA